MRFALPTTMTLAATVALLAAPTDAYACGGFFCNASQPVNQAAERIVFARQEDGSVTAVIQIQYSGPSEAFAWMLPVTGSPEIGVSSDSAFMRLQQATNPQYTLNTTTEGSCRGFGGRSAADSFGGAAAADGGAAMAPPEPEVTVVDQGAVGPYDYVVINVDPSAPNIAEVAVDWLTEEGYDVNQFGADRLEPYLAGGMNLLAFRLTKGNDAGSIRPVTLSFGNGLPSIPIRPTAVAADDDMGVMVWVLGEDRAVPVNYLSLELNEALINWLQPNSSYNDVVTRAANEAGGQGFVTEFAGESNPLAMSIFPEWEQSQWESIESTDWSEQHGTLLNQALATFGQHDGMRDVIRATVPVPMGVSRDDLLNCPGCFLDLAQNYIEGFDPAMFISELRTQVIGPLQETAQLFERTRVATRMYTTMSADEMTMDPIFDFNADLPMYSNIHTADRVIECSPSITRAEAPWRVTFGDGSVLRGSGNTWPVAMGEQPANRVTRRVGTEGEGRIVEDNTAAIQAALIDHNEDIPGPPPAMGCSAGRGATGSAFGLLLALGGLFLGRRRWSH